MFDKVLEHELNPELNTMHVWGHAGSAGTSVLARIVESRGQPLLPWMLCKQPRVSHARGGRAQGAGRQKEAQSLLRYRALHGARGRAP